MSFEVTGIFEGTVATVVWDAGEIVFGPESEPEDVAASLGVELHAARLEGRDVGPIGGPYTQTNHLRDPLSALFVIRDAFDDVGIAEGDVPEPPVETGDDDRVVY